MKIVEGFDFLRPDNMKVLGFDCVKDDQNGYLKYTNDGTKHRNPDYNREFPEPKGKVVVYVNFTYSNEYPYVGIKQDGDTRSVYGGIVRNESFLIELLNNVR